MTIHATGLQGERALSSLELAFAEIEAVHRCMSFHSAYSDLSHLNRAPLGVPIEIDARMYRVLECAFMLASQSNGLFDPTIGGALVARGYLPRPHSERSADPSVTWRDFELLEDGRAQRNREGWVDLGGIAKGYAVDQALAILQEAGFVSAVVNAGGDLALFGVVAETIALRIGDACAAISLERGAVATSFTSTNSDGPGNHLHGRTRNSVLGHRGASVVAPSCMIADALTKVVLADRQASEPLLRDRDAYAFIHDGDAWHRLGKAA